MKHAFIIVFFWCFLYHIGIAQDLIVTTEGDSIHCRITKTDDNYVYFTMKFENEFRNTLIPKQEIADKQINYFTSPLVPMNTGRQAWETKCRYALYGGYSKRIDKIDPELSPYLKKYVKDLMTGINLNVDIHIYISNMLGFGGVVSLYNAQNEASTMNLADNITVVYIGPSFQTRLDIGKQNLYMLSSTSIGYLKYINNCKNVTNYTIESNTVGFLYNISFDYRKEKNHGITFGINFLLGKLSELTITNQGISHKIKLEPEKYEGLNRLDLYIGLYMFD